jgi:hypothetical protein
LFEQLPEPAFIITPDGLILEGDSVYHGYHRHHGIRPHFRL